VQFLTQPFVVGERVTLMSGGSKVVTGRVESIDPLNTIIRDDEGVPITIPNTVMIPHRPVQDHTGWSEDRLGPALLFLQTTQHRF